MRIVISKAALAVYLVCFPSVSTNANAFAADWTAEAYSGKPLGVARVSAHFSRRPSTAGDTPIVLAEKSGRTVYPVFETASPHVAGVKQANGPTTITAYFLFRGDQSLDLTVRLDEEHSTKVVVNPDESGHKRLLLAWWARYRAAADATAQADAYPPLVESYLTGMLGRRLKLGDYRVARATMPWTEFDEVIGLLTGAESVRIAAQSKVLLGETGDDQKATLPLPESPRTPPIQLPDLKDTDVEIEPIAKHVPAECFYIRCGSYANFRWLRTSLDEWGTHIRHITSIRGYDYRLSERLERQLALRETVLGRMLGDTGISDVAIIGTDTFLREGASIGILFEAKSNTVLAQQIEQFRKGTLTTIEGATQRDETIAERKVSFLSTPDNSVRSFYAVEGKYHLVTTSRKIVERFFESSAGKNGLGGLEEFRWGRSKVPLRDAQTAFVYLSDPFFRQLIGPEYRVEMTRRAAALAEIDVARLAMLAAKAEGEKLDASQNPVEQLIAGGFLPKRYSRRPDGSHIVVRGNYVTDSLRGAPGSFLPVPDVQIDRLTTAERNAYDQFARRYESYWRRMDPVVIGITRKPLDGKKERVALDVHITPFARMHYQGMEQFLQIDERQWQPVAGDVVNLQANVNTRVLAGGIDQEKYSAGLRDGVPQFAIHDGQVRYALYGEEWIPGYIAASNPDRKAHSIVEFFLRNPAPADKDGDVAYDSLFGSGIRAYWRKLPDFDLLSPSKLILTDVAPQLKLVDAPRPAQIRIRVADLSQTGWAAMIDAESFIRARRVSAGNAQFLHALAQQLNVPLDQTRAEAERLLDARLVCPLGGKYELTGGFSAIQRWHSTAWQTESLYEETKIPKNFRSPLFNWFAGLSLDFHIKDPTLTTHIELDVRK
jgi:hypothetical protein